MRGLFVILLCATASNCSPLRGLFSSQQRPQQGQTGVNPFLQSSHIPNPSGGLVTQVDSHYHDSSIVAKSESSDVIPDDLHNGRPIGIVRQDSEVNPDGSYLNVWESENGIKVHEEGTVKVNGDEEIQSVRGTISYIDADGTPIHLSYVADENGFQPQGDHLPTPPPLPLSVARALEYIAAHPYVEKEQTHSEGSSGLWNEQLPIVEDA